MKSEIRRFTKNLRREMNKDQINEISDKIFENLINLDLYKNARSIFVYVSMDKEISTEKIIDKALEDGKEVYVPYLHNKTMQARKLESLDALVDGAFAIKTSPLDITITNPDLSLVPGLSFDDKKNRIGYGAGYYDRFLEKSKTTSIGLFMELARSIEIPTNEGDIPLDYILTENGIF